MPSPSIHDFFDFRDVLHRYRSLFLVMDKVLSLTDRLEDKKRKQNKEIHRQKIETLQRMIQCSSCSLSCAMCGSHLNVPDSPCPSVSSDQNIVLCQSCCAEYNDYLKISKGNKKSDIFWQNKEWMGLWATWLDYYRAIEKFKSSIEFMQLIERDD